VFFLFGYGSIANINPRLGSGSGCEPGFHSSPQYRQCFYAIFATSKGSEPLRSGFGCGSEPGPVYFLSTGFSFYAIFATSKDSEPLRSGFGCGSEPGPVYFCSTGFSSDFGVGSGCGITTKPGFGEIPGSVVGFIFEYNSILHNDKYNLISLISFPKTAATNLELFQGFLLEKNHNFNNFRNEILIRRKHLCTIFFKEHINHTSTMYRMDPEYDDLLRACGDEPAGEAEPDEHLLDVDDEEEILILEPPLAPTPADAPAPDPLDTDAVAMTAEKVNALVAEFENDDMNVSVNSGETYGTVNTKGTNFTYSKYGIRENTIEVTIDYDPERPQMKSAYYQCKMARAASLGSDSTSVDFDTNGGKTKPV
jgi:hypothetical protein